MNPIIVKVRHGLPHVGEMELYCNGMLMLKYKGRGYCFGQPLPLKITEEDGEALSLALEEALGELHERRRG